MRGRECRCNDGVFSASNRDSDGFICSRSCYRRRSSSIRQSISIARRRSDSPERLQQSSLRGSGGGHGGHLQGCGRLSQPQDRLIQISGPGRLQCGGSQRGGGHSSMSRQESFGGQRYLSSSRDGHGIQPQLCSGGYGLHIRSEAGSASEGDHSSRKV